MRERNRLHHFVLLRLNRWTLYYTTIEYAMRTRKKREREETRLDDDDDDKCDHAHQRANNMFTHRYH